MIQTVRGTKDQIPDNIASWQFLENVFKNVSDKFSYSELRTPIFEKTEVFSRSIGESSDIVNKEMYSFLDRGNKSITLRPEGTAGLVRAVIQNSLLQTASTLKLWYSGPFFRYERPQKGRMRQFHQYGAECISSANPESDAEIILLANSIIKGSGIKEYKLLLNTLGTDDTRSKFRNALIEYLSSKKSSLSEDSIKRLESNPLRILDSKSAQDREAIKDAPIILDFLDKDSFAHFNEVKSLIDDSGINIEIQPLLVRGLDYYCHTVFEFQSSALGAQDSLGGGGRYDGLFQQLGHKNKIPAVGFAMGIERLLLILEQTNSLPDFNIAPDIFIVSPNNELFKYISKIASDLREKYKVVYDLQRRSMKAQMREANKLKSRFTIIVGEDEINSGKILVKNMDNGEQEEVSLDKIGEYNFK